MDIHIHVGSGISDLVSQFSDVTEESRANGHLPMRKDRDLPTGRDRRIEALSKALRQFFDQQGMVEEAMDCMPESPDNAAGSDNISDYISSVNKERL